MQPSYDDHVVCKDIGDMHLDSDCGILELCFVIRARNYEDSQHSKEVFVC